MKKCCNTRLVLLGYFQKNWALDYQRYYSWNDANIYFLPTITEKQIKKSVNQSILPNNRLNIRYETTEIDVDGKKFYSKLI